MKNFKIYFCVLIASVVTTTSCKKKIQTPINLVEAPLEPIGTIDPNTGLKVFQNINQAGPSSDMELWTIYSSSSQVSTGFRSLPSGFDDKIKSFTIPVGHMAVFAENQDGTGESICYVAAVSDIKANIPARLVDKVSYVRFVPFRNTPKKGACQVNLNDVNALKAPWFYNWGLGGSSTPASQYVPMTWGRGSSNATNALTFINRRDIDHLLSFNEPDNASQANIPDINAAVTNYKFKLYTGYRLCSPAVEQDNSTLATDWLPQFVAAANAQKVRIDVIALHWYDWGNQNNNQSTPQATANAILNRFKSYITKLHTAYPNQDLWFTEYNCNPTRSDEIQMIFMKASAEYMNTLSYVERYAYFFPGKTATNRPTTGAPDWELTPMGKTWSDIASPPSLSRNIIPN